MKIGVAELIFVAVILMIVFSASRMSALGNALGKFVDSFRKAQRGNGFVDSKTVSGSSKTQPENAEFTERPRD
jgi:sec-independent protein translocase protein TatA